MSNLTEVISDDDHVSRYCSPRTVVDGMPTTKAFVLRGNDDYLSVNWLEYYGKCTLAECIDEVRKTFRSKNFGIKRNGRFVSLNVGIARHGLSCILGNRVRFNRLPTTDDESHSGIFGYESEGQNGLAARLFLAKIVHEEDVHEVVV